MKPYKFFTDDEIRQLKEIEQLLPLVCEPPVALALYPAESKEDAARWMHDNAMASTETDIWSVHVPALSSVKEDGTIHGVSSAITGNGPRSEAHARFYMHLHNLAPRLMAYMRANASEPEHDLDD